MIDLVAFLGFLIVLAGIADTILSRNFKTTLAERILFDQATLTPNLWINRIADRWLGKKLLSFRSFYRSAVFTLTALTLSVILAGFPKISFIGQLFDRLLQNSSTGFIAVCICIVGCIAADFISIAQTRLFARTIEKFNDRGITLILCIADVTMSIAFFVIIFSAFQVLSYIVVILAINHGQYNYDARYSPSVIASALDGLPDILQKVRESALSKSPNSDTKQLWLLYTIGKNPRAFSLDSVIPELRESDFKAVKDKDLIHYDLNLKCSRDKNGNGLANFEGYDLYTNSMVTLSSGIKGAGIEINASKFSQDYVRKIMIKQLNSRNYCDLVILDVNRRYNARNLLAELSPLDAYLASFSITLSSVFNSVDTKFSTYYEVDLGNSVKPFLAAGWLAKSQSLLGLFGTDSNAEATASLVNSGDSAATESVIIPFTTFAASSLLASVVLIAAITWNTLINLIRLVQNSLSIIVDKGAFSKIVLTSSTTILSMFLIAILVVWDIIVAFWHLLLS